MDTPFDVDEKTIVQCVTSLVKDGIPEDEARDTCRIALQSLLVVELRDESDNVIKASFEPVMQATEDERYVLGPVLIPNHVDSQGHIFAPTTVRKTAFGFMQNYKRNKLMHLVDLREQDVTIVESYIAPSDFELNGKLIKKGSWMMGLIIHNDALWKHIKEGRIRGFSIGASVKKPGMVLQEEEAHETSSNY